MNLLVVMKRFGANKDMVLGNFGRQIRLFEPLAKKHKIDFFCPDYVKKESFEAVKNKIKYIIRPASLLKCISLLKSLNSIVKQEKYDAIVATTDPIIGILCYNISKKYNIPLIYDLQDNFESYGSYKIPFVRRLDRKALKDADAVLAVSKTLKEHISKIRKKPVYVINNGIESDLFKPINKDIARKKLCLPLKSKIIVYMGHLEKLKGGLLLLNAFRIVRKKIPDCYLLISGKIEQGIDISQKNIIFRDFPKREEVVLGINSGDVAVLPNPLNNFTKYCFPYKLIEYMACGVPIVATDIGDVSLALKKYHGSLCMPNDINDLAEKIIMQLGKSRKVDYGEEVKSRKWSALAGKVDKVLSKVIKIR
ncbi:TPA: glycosyltransferase family 4 protein [Candidatus Woesearchaeota archaeon]|uniref:Putative glycosyl transferase, group 1 n=1 Tax=Candidatus Nomurabacteria bacterium GW2011_GWA2_40_9 TaxID=1618734 RepID=A0A0G0W4G0_9BACT|nr:MAG: putative glycosyl transferase, group 1 [Candidatus Nomurabacteria bacterium GW2011_GWA2_40_9]HIH41325.1 glycosyltransferase family 4 protein [Candidatus Woesearchaeota archaeon]